MPSSPSQHPPTFAIPVADSVEYRLMFHRVQYLIRSEQPDLWGEWTTLGSTQSETERVTATAFQMLASTALTSDLRLELAYRGLLPAWAAYSAALIADPETAAEFVSQRAVYGELLDYPHTGV
jgi:hypothetical protein